MTSYSFNTRTRPRKIGKRAKKGEWGRHHLIKLDYDPKTGINDGRVYTLHATKGWRRTRD